MSRGNLSEALREEWLWAQIEGIEALGPRKLAFTARMHGVAFDDHGEPLPEVVALVEDLESRR